jgi:hypothetical protein
MNRFIEVLSDPADLADLADQVNKVKIPGVSAP